MTCDATIISGTGRAGTTFLVALLTLCGAPTGFDEKVVNKTVYGTAAHAGLEVAPTIHNGVIVCTQNPRCEIFKQPGLADENRVVQWINATNLHTVIVPLRRMEDAARSREFQTKHHDPHRGGFTHANSVPSQISYFEHSVTYLMWQLSRHLHIETIILSYPEHVLDWRYSYAKLLPVLNRYDITMELFKTMHAHLSRKSFVHSFSAVGGANVSQPR
eukprot:scaffold1301_cov363-Pavlova_lutheri.AAC.1